MYLSKLFNIKGFNVLYKISLYSERINITIYFIIDETSITDSKGYLVIHKNEETGKFEMYYKQLRYLAIT